MRRLESRPLTARSVPWDAWRAKRGGPAAVAPRQQARLQTLAEYARGTSRFYAEHHRAVPSGPIRLEELRQASARTQEAAAKPRRPDRSATRSVNQAVAFTLTISDRTSHLKMIHRDVWHGGSADRLSVS